MVRYRDRDTRQIIYYIPSLELSDYGIIKEKAFEMLKASISDFFDFPVNLSQKDMKAQKP